MWCRSLMATALRPFGALTLVALLVACGGGGSSNDNGNGGSNGHEEPVPARFSISGSITPDALNRIDSDTNDPATPMLRNNEPDQAQPLLAPALIGGFVAAPGTASRFGPEGDEFDVYGVELQSGQQIVLEWPDADAARLGLYLLDADGFAVDATLDASATLTLKPDSAGYYFVKVRAYSGMTNYALRIDATHSLAFDSRRSLRVSDDFVPDELILRRRATHGLSPESTVHGLGSVMAGDPSREELWRLPSTADGAGIQSMFAWSSPSQTTIRWAEPSLKSRYRTLRTMQVLGTMPEIEHISLNYILQPTRLPNDPLQGLQWFHEAIDLPKAWSISTGSPPDADVVVAVVDTGVFLGHEDLSGKLLPGYDFIRMQPSGDDPGDAAIPGRSSWHGTHVAGTIAAASDNRLGIAGVSWGARVLPIRTLGPGGGTLYDTLQGIRYAAGLPNDSGTVPERRADVINLSLGGGLFTRAEAELYRAIRDQGIFVFAASGNSAGAVIFPAAYDAVFAVGATDAIDERARYSSFGNQLAFVAPGGDMRVDRTGDGFGDGILSTVADDTLVTRRSSYEFYQGTSMATAVASGVAGLARSVDPALNPDRFEQLLVAGRLTDDLGPPGWDPETGWGRINALRTLEALADNGSEDMPVLSANPGRLEFGFTEDVLEFSLANVGGGSVQVTEVIANTVGDRAWMAVSPSSVGPDGLGSYRVLVDRNGLSDGRYEGSIRIRADALEDLRIPVLLRVAPAELRADTVGRIYALLVDLDGETIAQQGLEMEEGTYRFQFDDVPAGEYRIVAGTDMNGDGFICDAGEACGAFPTLWLFQRVLVTEDRTGLDFSVGFRARLDDSVEALRWLR